MQFFRPMGPRSFTLTLMLAGRVGWSRDLEGESEHILLVSKRKLGLDLYWAENDTIYVGIGLGSGLLLSLD
jgi:hypothetical protein